MAIDPKYTESVRAAVEQQLPRIVPAADSAHAAGLTAAATIQTAQRMALSVNRARVAAKYGAASDQVGAMDMRLHILTTSMRTVQLAQARAQVQPPSLPAGSAAVFGRVVDGTGAGVQGAAVVALDASGAAVRKATTPADGSYQLVMPVRATKASRTAAIAAQAPPRLEVHLQVSVAGKLVLTSNEVLTLHAGDLAMRELAITVPAPDRRKD
jgi:hypothetical protein